MTLACRLFYRRVYATGLETIPSTGPVIIIANHSSSLMDAAVLGILLERPIHFFTRGDIFSGKITSRTLEALHMIPVHNYETNRNSLGINNESFLKASHILGKGGIIVFFPEGTSHIDRKLIPFRKGAFRLAFQSAKLHHSNIAIIPAGINYSHPTAFQADLMVHFGTPILLKNYSDEYLSNSAAALLHITKDSFIAIEKLVLNIPDETKFALAESCLQIKRNDYISYTNQWLQGTCKKLQEEKSLCSKILQLKTHELVTLQEDIRDYFKSLSLYQLNDQTLSPAFSFSYYKQFLLVTCFPLFAMGYILNCLPIIISRRIADTRVYRVDFYSWIFVTCAAFGYIGWLITLFLGFLIIGLKYSLAWVMLTMTSGLFVHQYVRWRKDLVQARRLHHVTRRHPLRVAQLYALRQKITERF